MPARMRDCSYAALPQKQGVGFDSGDRIFECFCRRDNSKTAALKFAYEITNEMHPALGHIHGPGTWFGEVESILEIDSYVQMEADAGTNLCRIELRKFRDIAAGCPKLWEAITRLTAYNLWLATQGSPPLDSIRASQQEIADLANVARTTASKILNEMQDSGMLRLDYGRIAILDEENLTAMLAE